jgi:MFS family permease
MRLADKRYLLAVLTAILAFNCVERLTLGLVLQNVKVDLGLSDTQLGLLTGIAFAAFYAVMGIPIARWADRGNRVAIIALSTALWSSALALCGMAANFLQLLLIRAGIAVGEAGCIPPAHSLIADHFSREERPRAAAIYMLGVPIGALVGFFLVGWLNEMVGWRKTFGFLGLPGFVMALIAWFTLVEPRAGSPGSIEAGRAATPDAPGIQEAFATLWRNVTFRQLLLCFSVTSFFGAGMLQWKPSFFIRSFGFQTGELGTWFAIIYGLGGLVGTYLGGELASRYAARNERLQLRAMALVYCAVGGISACAYLSTNPHLALALMALIAIVNSMINGPIFATIQTLMPERLRAVSIALLYLFANLIGMGLGPLAAGVLSDAFTPWAGNESLRYAMLALCPGYLWGAWHLMRASKTVAEDVMASEGRLSGRAS